MNIPPVSESLPPPFEVSPETTRRVMSKLKVRKAPGPDGISPQLLCSCKNELCEILSTIYNWSLRECHLPSVFKKSIIIPVPKRSPVTCLNDYRPIALTSIVMRYLETIVRVYIQSNLPASLDPYQFAYKADRSVDDAVSWALFNVNQFLDKKVLNYVRFLFIDYSSAFNTVSSFQLFEKLLSLDLNQSICKWILDFLLERSQVVKIGSRFSKSITLNTGTPQGCNLSSLLYSLFTHDFVANSNVNFIVKFADDTTLGGLISKNNETEYRNEVENHVKWCSENNLKLNVKNTKEIIVDFCENPSIIKPLVINNSGVEVVQYF